MRIAASWTLAAALALGSEAASASTGPDSLGFLVAPILMETFALGATPGMAVAVVRGHERWASGLGFADREAGRAVTPETIFYIASTTKSFTALAAALLHQRGALDLDAPMSRYLPGVQLAPPLDPTTIRVRDLLTHTHGISNEGPVVFRTAYTGEFTDQLLLDLLRQHPPAPTGRAFAYGNLGYNIVGLILDAQFEPGWKSVVDKEVIQPLGLQSTSAWISRVPPERLAMPYEASVGGGFERVPYAKTDANMHAAGGLVSSAADLAIYLDAHLHDGKLGDRQVWPAAAVQETRKCQVDQDRQFGEIHRFGWGLGWDLGTYDDETVVHRFGSFPGFRSHLSFMPERGIGVVVLVNGGGAAGPFADLVALSIYDRLLGRADAAERRARRITEYAARAAQARQKMAEDAAKRAARPQALPHRMSAYAGQYESPLLGRMTWRVTGERLEAQMGVAECVAETYDGEKNQLRVELDGSGGVVEFRFPENGGPAAGLRFRDADFTRVAD